MDVWGAGCCFYEAMVGNPPFFGASHRALQVRAARGLSEYQKKRVKGEQRAIGELIISCLNPISRLRPNACTVVDRGLAAMSDVGIDDRSHIVRSIPLVKSTLQRRLVRPTAQKLPSMLPPFKVSSLVPTPLPPVIEAESTPAADRSTKSKLEGIYPLVSHRPGRTLDFDNARHRGQRVSGYKYMGKVYVMRS